MTENPAQSYVLSAALHGAVVAVCLLLAYLAEAPAIPPQKVFELVAGTGDNYAATEAPAIGVPNGNKLIMSAPEPTPPEPPAPVPPAPPVAAAVPIEPAPTPVPVPIKPAPTHAKPKPAPTVPNFSKTIARTASRTENRLVSKEKKKEEAEQKRQAAAQKQMSYDQYLKEHGEGIASGVVGGSTANKTGGAGGKALKRDDGPILDAYFALLKSRLKESHVAPPDVSDSLTAHVSFFVSANGSISNVEIDRGSGSAAFDESVREAFRQIRSGVGPRPDHQGGQEGLEFSMKESDSN
jgi:colicin import membrane protein